MVTPISFFVIIEMVSNMITSVNNSKVKDLLKLKNAKDREKQGLFLVEGPHLVSEAKKLGILIEYYTVNESDLNGVCVAPEVMKKISDTSGSITEIGVCKLELPNKIGNKVLLLDGIQDPGNLGALMRSAVAFGFDTLFLSDGCVDLYNSKVIRSSQGAFFKLNYRFGDIVEFIKSKLIDYSIYSTDVKNGIDIKSVPKTNKVALILGNEGNGVSNVVKNLKLPNIYISIKNTESLNVSVAGAILMYELNK